MKIICVIAALAVLVTIPLSVWSAEDGAEIYKKTCIACHGEKGEGKPAAKMPAVKGTQMTEEQVVTYLAKGEKGKTFHANPFAAVNEEQAKAVAAFIKTFK